MKSRIREMLKRPDVPEDVRDMFEKYIGIAERRSEKKYQLIFENSPLGHLFFDERGTIIECNESFMDLIGSTRDNLIGLSLLELPDEKVVAAVKKSLGGENGFYEGTYEIATKNTPVRAFFWPLIENGEILGGIGIVESMAGRLKAEEERIKVQKLESLEILAGGIAHDFNNFLTQIMGYASLLLGNLSPEKHNKFVETILNACEKATGLTKQLLTFSKGGLSVIKPGSISKIIKETAELVLGRSSVCSYALDLPRDLWLAKIDVQQISQVITNLLINAKQAMPEGGVISISANNLRHLSENNPALKAGAYVRITVQDTGIGIPEEYLQKIFDPYFSTKSKESTNSGLGLATANSIIRRHEGCISVESKRGNGAAFHISLPAIERETRDAGHEIAEEQSVKTKSLRILALEDEPIIKNLLIEIIDSLGHHIEAVSDGGAAIELCRKAHNSKKPFDLAILDLTIPGKMGGIETRQKLLEINPAIKTIASSGYSNAAPEGFTLILPKPYTLQVLREAIEKIFKE